MRTGALVLSLSIALGAALFGLASCVGEGPAVSPVDGSSSGGPGTPEASSPGSDASGDGGTPNDGSTSDGGTDAEAGPFSPADLGAKLVLWLESSPANYTLASGSVTVWNDLSSFHSNALKPASDTGPSPVLPDASAPIQGHEPLMFSGENYFLSIPDGPNLNWGTRDFAIFAVVRGVGAPVPIFDKNEKGVFGNQTHLSFGLDNDYVVAEVTDFDGGAAGQITTANPIMADSAYHLVGLRRYAQTNLELRVDTVVTGPAAMSPISLDMSGVDVTFGGVPYVAGPLKFWDARFMEIVAIESTSGSVPASDVTAVEAYLKAKYGL